MSRTSRWLVGIAAGFLVLLIAGFIVVTTAVDPNSYRGRIEQAVRDATGRAFELHGDIDIAWFPWLALETGSGELGNPSGFDANVPLLRWQAATVGVRVVPLLGGQLVVDRIRVDGLQVNLAVNARGGANWEDLAQRTGEEGARESPLPANAGLEIRSGAVTYLDARSDTRLEMTDWTLDIGAFRSGEPVSVRTAFRYRDVPVAFREDALTVDLETLRLAAPGWSLQLGEARLEGALRTEERLQGIEGTVRGAVPVLRELLIGLGAEPPRTRDADALGALRLAGTYRYDRGTLTVQPIELTLDETTLAGRVSRSAAAGSTAESVWTFELTGDRIDLDRYRAADEAPDEPFELPVAQLRAANVRGTLTFEHARLAGIGAQDLKLSVETDSPSR